MFCPKVIFGKRTVFSFQLKAIIFPVLILLCIQLSLSGQVTSHLKEETVFRNYCDNTHKENNEGYSVILYQSDKCPALNNHTIVRKITPQTAIIRTPATQLPTNASDCIVKIAPANNNWKLSALLEEKATVLQQSTSTAMLFTVTAVDITALFNSLRQKKTAFTVVSVFGPTQSATIKCKPAVFFKELLTEPGLLFADVYVEPATDAMVTGYNRVVSSINAAGFLLPAVNGNGIVMGIKEKKMDGTDIDLQTRVLPSVLASATEENHATIITTLAGGAGNSFSTGKGVAGKCLFFPSSFSNLFPDSSQLLTKEKVSVQNHSYGTVIQPFYGAEAAGYDVQAFADKNIVHVFSSGNMGTAASTTGKYANINGYANLTGNFKMAKNVVTVAALDTGGMLASFSSAGPLYDGRLGPQLTALGANGTSEAAPLVSGAVALLQQVYKDSNAQVLPAASLVKAIVYTTADDIGNKYIDYRSGFGLLNVYQAIQCLQQRKYDGNSLKQSQSWTKKLTVPAGAANLKITLCWTDTAARVNDNQALVNDLDITLIEMKTGVVYKPWCLSVIAHRDSLQKLPERRRDSLNTAEQISIALPVAGQYEIKVNGYRIQTINSQPFHIAWNWDTLNTFAFLSPLEPEEVNREEKAYLAVKWKTAVPDTNVTGSLYVSFNNGIQWRLINNAVKLHRQFIDWPIPDTSTRALLRMDAGFGQFYSQPFAIAPLTKVKVDYRCTDSVRLSWKKNRLANAYQVYALGEGAYLQPVVVVTDTFFVARKDTRPEKIFAVKPLSPDGTGLSRSIAIDIRNQGVECFYRAIRADADNDKIVIKLEMSFLKTVDSIVFEKTTATGSISKTIKRITPSAGKVIYEVADMVPVAGPNYYRAKIGVSGQFIYTEIVSAFSTGGRWLLVYPSPVMHGAPINYHLKEAAIGSTLRVIDAMGHRLADYQLDLSGQLSTRQWLPGIYFYHLLNARGVLLETGKMVIQ
jgi:hypothetical protein